MRTRSRIQYARPSANLLFSSLAFAFKQHALGVILTGYGSDGAVGLSLLKAMGGTVIAQDERSSATFDMPSAAINMGAADLTLPLDKIAPALISLTMVPGAAELFLGSGGFRDAICFESQ
jgi:two-component system chemotaxis response regulator CheB